MLLFSQVYYIWEKMCTYVLLYHGFYLLDHLYFFPESNQNQVPFLFKWWIWGLRQTARLNWIANRFHFTRLEDRARCYDELNTTYYLYLHIFADYEAVSCSISSLRRSVSPRRRPQTSSNKSFWVSNTCTWKMWHTWTSNQKTSCSKQTPATC